MSCLRGISWKNYYYYDPSLLCHHHHHLPVLVPSISNLSVLQSSQKIYFARQSWNSSSILYWFRMLVSAANVFKNKQIMFQRDLRKIRFEILSRLPVECRHLSDLWNCSGKVVVGARFIFIWSVTGFVDVTCTILIRFKLENGTVSQTITPEWRKICVNFIVYLIETVENSKIPEHMFRYMVRVENRLMKHPTIRMVEGVDWEERSILQCPHQQHMFISIHCTEQQSTELHIGGRYGFDHMALGCCHMIPQS